MRIKQLYEQYNQDIFHYLIYLTGDALLAEDLVSETFLGAIKSLPRFKGDSDIKTWLFSIARYKWYEHLRKNRETPSQDELVQHYLADGPEEVVLRRALYDAVLRLLAQEPPRTQSIVRLRIEGYSYLEIAQRHNISESSARVIDFRAKRKIRMLLEQEGMSYD